MRFGTADKRKLELTHIGRWCLILINLTASAAWLTGDDSARLAMAQTAISFNGKTNETHSSHPRTLDKKRATQSRSQSTGARDKRRGATSR